MRGSRQVIDRIRNHVPSDLALSAVTLAEILYGIEKSESRKKERSLKIRQITSLLDLYTFDRIAAEKYAVIRAKLEKEGRIISERDIQIASIAMANQLIVVTHNVKEFIRVESLEVEDWAITL